MQHKFGIKNGIISWPLRPYNSFVSRDLMDYRPVRLLVKAWVVFLIVAPLVLVTHVWLASVPFKRDFHGLKESEVVALIGAGTFQREDGGRPSERPAEYWRQWSYGYGARLSLHFKDGVVVEQTRGSR